MSAFILEFTYDTTQHVEKQDDNSKGWLWQRDSLVV